MVASVNPPPLQVPPAFLQDKLMQAFFSGLINTLYQLWTQTFSIRIKTKVLTTDGSITAALRVPISDGHSTMIAANIVARRTGGAGAGAVGDTAWYQLIGCYKNIGGVLTGVGSPSLIGGEDVAAWNVGFSFLANEALITVLGEPSVNITWELTVSTYDVGA
jgi:hypothetical protein